MNYKLRARHVRLLKCKWYSYATVLVVIIVLSATSCERPAVDKGNKIIAATDKMYVEVKTFETTTGWGYAVYADNKLYIQQPFIPDIAGKHGFASQNDALKAGNLVLKKMNQQQRFPVISKQELQALEIALP